MNISQLFQSKAMTKTANTTLLIYSIYIICNRKQGHYSDRTICEMMTLNEIRYNPETSTFC